MHGVSCDDEIPKNSMFKFNNIFTIPGVFVPVLLSSDSVWFNFSK